MALSHINHSSIPDLIRASNDGTLYKRSAPQGDEKSNAFKAFGDDGLTFSDVLDVVNPLQHIPVLGHIYRKLTGDEIDPASKLAGATLYGGPIGAAFSVASSLVTNMFQDKPSAVEQPDNLINPGDYLVKQPKGTNPYNNPEKIEQELRTTYLETRDNTASHFPNTPIARRIHFSI